MKFLADFIKGALIGIANIIPGVSGGTFALILGIYDRLITALNNLTPYVILEILKLLLQLPNKEKRDKLFSLLNQIDSLFLVRIGIGAMTSIILLSKLLKYLILNHYEFVYAYFSGLIFLSLIIPYKLLDRKRFPEICTFILGLALTIYIAAAVNPAEKAKFKSEKNEKLYYSNLQIESKDSNTLATNHSGPKKTTRESPGTYVYLFICGILAISAMVLPGISGSFVLLLLGQYLVVITAISRLPHFYLSDWLTVIFFGAGCGIGLFLFARLFEFIYERYKNQTVAFLIGLMVGSFYALWPFKHFEYITYFDKVGSEIIKLENYKLYSNLNRFLPEVFSWSLIGGTLLFFGLGCFTMYFFVKEPRETV